MTEEHPQETYKDELAELVRERYERAKRDRQNRVVFHNKSTDTLIEEADRQFRCEYSTDLSARIQDAFGVCPTSYWSVTQQKVPAWAAWMLDLLSSGLDSLVTVVPTPSPTIDEASRRAIRAGVERDLRQRIMERGTGMSEMLTTANGKIEPIVKEFMKREATRLKEVEQLRIVGVASQAAKRATVKMRDHLVEGGFKTAFTTMVRYQGLYGLSFVRFPHWKNVNTLQYSGKGTVRKNVMRPVFRTIHPSNMYCIADADNMQENTANIERTTLTKRELVQMASDKRYDKKAIEEILMGYAEKQRNWLDAEYKAGEPATYWGPDEPIDCLIHEGFVSGKDLDTKDMKLKPTEIVCAHVVVCLGRVILAEVKKNTDRTYNVIPYVRTGPGIYDAIGIAALVHDIEEEINVLRMSYKSNLAWSASPPIMANSSVFQNPMDAKNIQPGKQYEIADSYIGGSAPEPLRAMRGASSIFHLIGAEINQLIAKASQVCGLPDYAFGSSDKMGASSLGEYSQRLSGALRTVKSAAFEMDVALGPCFMALFRSMVEEDKDGFTEGMDLDCQFMGIMGLIQGEASRKSHLESLPLVQASVDRGTIGKDVEKYAVLSALEAAGMPLNALGAADDLFAAATAEAGSLPNRAAPGQGMVPELDGRSAGAPQGTVASPSGASNYIG